MTVRDQAFLYCFLIYGQQKEEILAVLPAERAEMLKKEVKKFDRFPKEVRLTIVLKLLGYLVQHIRNRNLEMVHPTWIAESLRNENASITLGILNQFSSDYRERVLDFLTVTDIIHAPSIVISDHVTSGIQRLATDVIQIPVSLDEFATPLLYILPMHVFGYEMALQRGYDPTARRYDIVPQKVRYQEED